jgi:hypothetical protein
VLSFLKDNGEYEPLSEKEMDEFERAYPDIAKYWLTPGLLDQLQMPKLIPSEGGNPQGKIFETWQQGAARMMAKLWKTNNAWIFHNPVDPDQYKIPDYHQVIAKPIDFGTIRHKLETNQYKDGIQEFLYDVNLTFTNCLKYNGEDS